MAILHWFWQTIRPFGAQCPAQRYSSSIRIWAETWLTWHGHAFFFLCVSGIFHWLKQGFLSLGPRNHVCCSPNTIRSKTSLIQLGQLPGLLRWSLGNGVLTPSQQGWMPWGWNQNRSHGQMVKMISTCLRRSRCALWRRVIWFMGLELLW